MMINKILRTEFMIFFDRLVHLKIQIGHLSCSSFRVFGCAGLLLAILLEVSLIQYLGLSQIIMAGIAIAAMATFLVLALATKIVIGEERLIYYHHEIAIMLVSTAVLWWLGQPILPYLDIAILGIGTFLTFGRIGCLMVGCCHGRPSHFGVCYREEHAHAGFTPYYVGVRLFPIQAVESMWVFGIVLVGIAMVLLDFPAGAVLAWYIIMYDIGRFFFEFMRGDPSRQYWKGFSEGQWTSLILMIVVVALELSGKIPYEFWHLCAAVLLVLVMVVVALQRQFQKTKAHQLTNPRHIRELAEALSIASGSAAFKDHSSFENAVCNNIAVGSTSLGILISASHLFQPVGAIRHYAISHRDGEMNESIAKTIAGVIAVLKPSQKSQPMIKGKHGVYHLLFRH